MEKEGGGEGGIWIYGAGPYKGKRETWLFCDNRNKSTCSGDTVRIMSGGKIIRQQICDHMSSASLWQLEMIPFCQAKTSFPISTQYACIQVRKYDCPTPIRTLCLVDFHLDWQKWCTYVWLHNHKSLNCHISKCLSADVLVDAVALFE